MKYLRFISLHEMVSLDPNTRLSDSSAATPVLKLVCPNLVKLDREMQIRPELAQSWTISEDGKTYRFVLRDSLCFHNGDPLTAESIAWNFQRIFDSLSGSVLAEDFKAIKGVQAITATLVEFRLHHPWPAFLHHLAGRCHIIADTAMQPIGAGPFRLVEWVRGSHLRLQRFEGYWNSKDVQAEEIVVTWAANGVDRIRLIENGMYDIMESVPGGAAASLVERGLVETSSAKSTTRLTLAMNCRRPPFDNADLRRALAASLDRKQLATRYAGPHGHATDLVWNDQNRSDENTAPAAKTWLGQADERPITVQGVMTNVSPTPQVASDVGAMLRDVGIELDLRGYDDPPWWPMIYSDTDWQIAFQGMGTRAHPDMLFSREFCTAGSFNSTGYTNPRLDELIENARRTSDLEKQHQLYDEAQQIILNDMPVIVLYGSDTLVGVRPGVQGFVAHPLGYWNLDEVSL